jgi:hypothetical protein
VECDDAQSMDPHRLRYRMAIILMSDLTGLSREYLRHN